MPELDNPRWEQFAQLYVHGETRGNAHRSYIAAGYKDGPGTSARSSHLTRNVSVSARIRELQAEQFKRLHMTSDEILAQLARIARADVRDVFDAAGKLRPVTEIDPDTAAALNSVEVVTTRVPGGEPTDVEYTVKIKIADKLPALRTLAQHAKLIGNDGDGADRLAHALADRLEAARKRRKAA